MNKNEDLWKWALLVLVSQTVSHPWIRSDEVIGWTWSSLKTNLVLITHTYPITRSFFKILHIRNNLQSNNQLGIIFGNGECVIVGKSSTKVLLFCFKRNCYLYWGNRIPPMNAFPFLFSFSFFSKQSSQMMECAKKLSSWRTVQHCWRLMPVCFLSVPPPFASPRVGSETKGDPPLSELHQ